MSTQSAVGAPGTRYATCKKATSTPTAVNIRERAKESQRCARRIPPRRGLCTCLTHAGLRWTRPSSAPCRCSATHRCLVYLRGGCSVTNAKSIGGVPRISTHHAVRRIRTPSDQHPRELENQLHVAAGHHDTICVHHGTARRRCSGTEGPAPPIAVATSQAKAELAEVFGGFSSTHLMSQVQQLQNAAKTEH